MNNGVCVIVNPAAGRGRGERALTRIREIFGAVGVDDVRVSGAAGDESALARHAIDRGCSTLAAVGGDGTWRNVADAILRSGADCRLALLAAGTGNDFAKTAGVPAADYPTMARHAVEGPDGRVDAGRVEGHYFLNGAGFGFSLAVLEDMERVTWLRGDARYLFSALRQLFGYGGIPIDIASPQGRRQPVRHLMLMVANARQFGGTFRIAPGASVTDGRLDAVSVLDAPVLRRVRLFQAATRGTHTALPEVVVEQAESFTLRFEAPPAFETDGEFQRAGSPEVRVECVPQALRVIMPPSVATAA